MANRGTDEEHDSRIAKFIAIVVRNAMENFHSQRPSDAQMKELNPTIRNAIFTALQALRLKDQSFGARLFVEFQSALIPSYWEEPHLLDDYLAVLELNKVGCPACGMPTDCEFMNHDKQLQEPLCLKDRKIGVRDLRAGGKYLHNNGFFIRTIDRLDGKSVYWHNQHGSGVCSKAHFLKTCHEMIELK